MMQFALWALAFTVVLLVWSLMNERSRRERAEIDASEAWSKHALCKANADREAHRLAMLELALDHANEQAAAQAVAVHQAVCDLQESLGCDDGDDCDFDCDFDFDDFDDFEQG